MPEAIWAHYKGDGTEHIYGVPARHLTENDRDALTAEQRRAVRNVKQSNGQPLYAVRTDAEMHPSRAEGKLAPKGGE